MTTRNDTRLALIFLIAVAFAAAEWGGRDVRFGVTILFVAFVAFLAGRRTAGKRWMPARHLCEFCQDTGIQPGRDHGTLITLPAPCIHCERGQEAGNRLADVIKNSGFGGLPSVGPSREGQVRVVVDFFESWRFCPVSTAAAPSAACLEDAANQLLDALSGVTPER